MTETEQIEEIARTICRNYDQENNKCLCNLENGVCDLDCWAGRHPSKALYDAGYRKAFEVAREIIAVVREMINGYENIDVYLDRIEEKYGGTTDDGE